MRFTYPDFVARVHRLAGALTALGAKPGMRIAIAEWDSHRYLEAYFAVPMLGCVLMMVNIRLSPAQIAYTLSTIPTRKSCSSTRSFSRSAGPSATGSQNSGI